MGYRYTHGVSDYTFGNVYSKINVTDRIPTARGMTEDEKTQAADVLDKFKTNADFIAYKETADWKKLSDPVKFAVTQAVYSVGGFKSPITLSVPDPTGSKAEDGDGSDGGGTMSTKETPWLLYAAGAAVLFLLLKK